MSGILCGKHKEAGPVLEHAISADPAIPALPPVTIVECIGRYRRSGRISEFRGSAIRGCFGRALRATSCVLQATRPCGATCARPQECAVAHLFETPPLPAGIPPTRFRNPPHPIALRVASPGRPEVDAGEEECFGWSVLEPATKWIPAIATAVTWMSEAGLGAERVQFEVVRIRTVLGHRPHPLSSERDQAPTVPAPIAGRVRIQLETPLRLQSDGKPRMAWSTDEFIRAVVRRTWLLAEFYGGETRHPPDAAVWSVRDERPAVRWEDRQRFSSRQASEVPWGGLLGEVELHDVPPALAQLLRMAEAIQLGKGTSIGLGRVEVTPI